MIDIQPDEGLSSEHPRMIKIPKRTLSESPHLEFTYPMYRIAL
jgi:hypothetical protein